MIGGTSGVDISGCHSGVRRRAGGSEMNSQGRWTVNSFIFDKTNKLRHGAILDHKRDHGCVSKGAADADTGGAAATSHGTAVEGY